MVQDPLSPQVKYQNSPNPCKSLNLQGFLFGAMPNHSSKTKTLVSDSVSKLSQKIYSPVFYQIILMYWRHRLQDLLLIMYKELLGLPAMLRLVRLIMTAWLQHLHNGLIIMLITGLKW